MKSQLTRFSRNASCVICMAPLFAACTSLSEREIQTGQQARLAGDCPKAVATLEKAYADGRGQVGGTGMSEAGGAADTLGGWYFKGQCVQQSNQMARIWWGRALAEPGLKNTPDEIACLDDLYSPHCILGPNWAGRSPEQQAALEQQVRTNLGYSNGAQTAALLGAAVQGAQQGLAIRNPNRAPSPAYPYASTNNAFAASNAGALPQSAAPPTNLSGTSSPPPGLALPPGVPQGGNAAAPLTSSSMGQTAAATSNSQPAAMQCHSDELNNVHDPAIIATMPSNAQLIDATLKSGGYQALDSEIADMQNMLQQAQSGLQTTAQSISQLAVGVPPAVTRSSCSHLNAQAPDALIAAQCASLTYHEMVPFYTGYVEILQCMKRVWQ
jgi:hypothetical protein